MSLLQELRAVSGDLPIDKLLGYLLKERFTDKTAVTVSLRAPSIVVLKMIADIDPTVPVIFCQRGYLFPESREYRDRIVEQLGLTNISDSSGGESDVLPGDLDHFERMWSQNKNAPGRTYEIVHLNQSLAPYDCWISAVYHMDRLSHLTHRVEVEGRLVFIDPLVRWTKERVRQFMLDNNLPFHPFVAKGKPEPVPEDQQAVEMHHY